MSRIFDALERASRDRTSHSAMIDDLVDDKTFAGFRDVAEPIGPDVIGALPACEWVPQTGALVALQNDGVSVEQFRRLRTRLCGLRAAAPLKTILVCSAVPEEGKSLITTNLALTLARTDGNRVLLIDGDLRRPSLHILLGAPPKPGLSEFLAGDAQVCDILQRGDIRPEPAAGAREPLPNLAFIPSGNITQQAAELTASHRLQQLIASVSDAFDWILIDSAPVLAVSDALQMSASADAVLLVARSGKTRFKAAQQAQALLERTRILGVVLNDAPKPSRNTRYDYYYHSVPKLHAGNGR